MATTNVTIRMDEELKKQADDLFSDLGLSMTAALIAFTKQAVKEQRIPFVISRNVPNAETICAIEEIEKMKRNPEINKGYDDVDEMMTELLN
ncbi:type II toxin-antitoxin system RelB/DinJ family antitoxin [Acetobacterium sp.]|uniref:type II toxin-antitoxin system RelB/DinJ family antitoxin n=1 Tax=Acetobacterium sp. TaxID=1872094 RepID=UPI002F42FF49